MNRFQKKVYLAGISVFFFIIGIAAGWFSAKSFYASDNSRTQESNVNEEQGNINFKEEDFLWVNGTEIQKKNGEKTVLRGVNLGGWMIQEYWMCPIWGGEEVQQWTHMETLHVLEERFGREEAQRLIHQYEDNWITEKDFERIAELGCNVIRVPIGFFNFMYDEDGNWMSDNPDDNPGIQRLDWILEMADRYKLYVIIDLHACPGGQSKDHCAGNFRKCELYTNEQYQQTMEDLWRMIALRYKDNPTVAGYDIMNEPGLYQEISNVMEDPRNQLYDRMINAIREVDSKHILIVEGIWSLDVLPDPGEMGWENIVYSCHVYGSINASETCENLLAYQEAHQVPIYIGEFADLNLAKECFRNDISYTSWTYKGTKYAEGPWYVYEAEQDRSVDIYHDSIEMIERKWSEHLQTEYFRRNEDTASMWTKPEA